MSYVINLVGGPGSGKSTTAAGLFFLMKIRGLRCELVTEYAKELSYDKNWSDLKRQLHVLAEQERHPEAVLQPGGFSKDRIARTNVSEYVCGVEEIIIAQREYARKEQNLEPVFFYHSFKAFVLLNICNGIVDAN